MVTITLTMKALSILSIASSALRYVAVAAEPANTTSDTQAKLLVSAQLGPYPVSIYDHEIQTSRPDPLAPKAELRRLMVTVYRPFLDNFTCPPEHQSRVPYAPPVVAAALLKLLSPNESSTDASSILAPVQLMNCTRPFPSSSPSGPLLLFSPGLSGTHHIYAGTLQAAASSGYTVVAIDHTYEAAAVVFPDGSVAYTNTSVVDPSDLSNIDYLQSIRDADTVSVLDAIERGDVPGLGRYSNSDTSSGGNPSRNSTADYGRHSTNASSSTPLRALMYGHSLGGSTAANVAASDGRVLAAVNIDGTFFGPVANQTIRKPLLLIGSQVDAGWQPYYQANVRGWKSWVRLDNSVHYGFTDLPLLADLLGLRGAGIPAEYTGTVDSRRLQEIVWRYTLQFFAYVLDGRTPDLLLGQSAEFPDVEFVGHAEAGRRR